MGPPSTADMNITSLDARTLNMDALHTAANSVPFLSERRLVILVQPYAAFKGAKELKKISEFLQNLPPTTIMALIETLDLHEIKNKSFYDWLQKLCSSFDGKTRIQTRECNMPDREKLPNWIIQETIKQAEILHKTVRIDASAAVRLAEMVGEDTRIAAQEIGKLLEYVNFSRDVTMMDVEQVCIVSSQTNVFDLVDAIGNKNGKKAQQLLFQLLQDEESFTLWGMVIRQFRLLLQAREVMDGRGTADDIAREIHVHPYVAGKLYGQAKKVDLPGLEAIYHHLLELDENMKTGQLTTNLALEQLVVELSG